MEYVIMVLVVHFGVLVVGLGVVFGLEYIIKRYGKK